MSEMTDSLLYKKNVGGDINKIYDLSREWVIYKKGNIVDENRPYYIHAENYFEPWGTMSAGNFIEIKLMEKSNVVNVSVNIPKVLVTSFQLFLKAHNAVFLMIIEDYYRFIGFEFTNDDLRDLYPASYLMEMIFVSLFLSIFLLFCSATCLIIIFDYYPHYIVYVSGVFFIGMAWVSYPHLRSLLKSISLFSQLYLAIN